MTPAKNVGGDYYDFFPVDDDHIGLDVLDIARKIGHCRAEVGAHIAGLSEPEGDVDLVVPVFQNFLIGAAEGL